MSKNHQIDCFDCDCERKIYIQTLVGILTSRYFETINPYFSCVKTKIN